MTGDKVWRAEQRPDGWRVYFCGGLVLQRATLDEVVKHLLAKGVAPTTMVSG